MKYIPIFIPTHKTFSCQLKPFFQHWKCFLSRAAIHIIYNCVPIYLLTFLPTAFSLFWKPHRKRTSSASSCHLALCIGCVTSTRFGGRDDPSEEVPRLRIPRSFERGKLSRNGQQDAVEEHIQGNRQPPPRPWVMTAGSSGNKQRGEL